MSDDHRWSRLRLVEIATVALALSLLVGLVSLVLAPFAAALLAGALWWLAEDDLPPPLPRRLRQCALVVGAQAALLVAAGIVALTVGRPSPPFTVLNTLAGGALLAAIHLYVAGMRAALPADTEADRRFGRAWRTLRLVDVVLAAAVALSLALVLANDALENVDVEASIALAPAAVLGLGMLYRLTRAQQALHHHLADEVGPDRPAG